MKEALKHLLFIFRESEELLLGHFPHLESCVFSNGPRLTLVHFCVSALTGLLTPNVAIWGIKTSLLHILVILDPERFPPSAVKVWWGIVLTLPGTQATWSHSQTCECDHKVTFTITDHRVEVSHSQVCECDTSTLLKISNKFESQWPWPQG